MPALLIWFGLYKNPLMTQTRVKVSTVGNRLMERTESI